MSWQGRAVLEPGHGFPVLAQVDVCVVGGGAAGVAAAETAARHGRSVLLVERYGFCGGNAVGGLGRPPNRSLASQRGSWERSGKNTRGKRR